MARRLGSALVRRSGTALAASALTLAACTGQPNPDLEQAGREIFEGPVVQPLALSDSGQTLVRVNPLHGTITVFDLSGAEPTSFDVPVGLEPVSVAFRPGSSTEVLVANHISDSVSVVDLTRRNVVQTIQGLDADGVSTTNEPTGIAFHGGSRAFVTLDQPDEVIVLDRDAQGAWSLRDLRLPIAAQGPRALAVAGDALYVAAFESGNRSVAASCVSFGQVSFPCDRGNPIFPGLGSQGRTLPIRIDEQMPDRDVFVFDVSSLPSSGTLAPTQVVEGVGTLLYGLASDPSGGRVYVTQTEALNHQNGDVLLTNRVFENRLAVLDCGPTCTTTQLLDLDAAALAGATAPTPYGVALSEDGETLVVTAAGADASDAMPGLFVLDVDGASASLVGQAVVGSIPQGVVLRSDAGGAAETAFVWNSIGGEVAVVDVSDPSAPVLTDLLEGPPEVLPAVLAQGRLAFRSARASQSGTFSCESCHPNGHIDQLAWVLNREGEPPLGGSPANSTLPQSRVTLSVRGLRDTLPLHWDGTLGKPLPPTPNVRPVPQSCALEGQSTPDAIDESCFLDLVDASLAGVMCQLGACPVTEGKPGKLGAADRFALAAYASAVAATPPPLRRPDDQLSESALAGVQSFVSRFDPDIGGPVGGCANTGAGCHEFPLGVPGQIGNGFSVQAGQWRTMADRFQIGSNSGPSSRAILEGFVEQTGWDPAVGMDERASFRSFVFTNFLLPSVVSDHMFDFLLEMSSGYSGLLGRQLTISPAMVDTAPERAAVLAQAAVFEQAAREGRVTLVGRVNTLVVGSNAQLDGAFDPEGSPTDGDPGEGCWELVDETTDCYRTESLLAMFATFPAVARATIRADLPANVTHHPEGFATADLRQPLISHRPGNELAEGASGSLRVVAQNVVLDTLTSVYVDGVLCADCAIALTGPLNDENDATITLDPVPSAGTHVVLIQSPRAWISNELPFVVTP